MNVKLDGQQHSAEADRTRRGASATAPGHQRSSMNRVGPGADRVETSPDLRLAAAAMQTICESSPIRPEALERARQAMADGTLGADANRLADRILTALLEP